MKKYLILTILMTITALVVFSVMAHTNPKGKHPVGIETDSCQGALAGAEEQLADRGKVNSRLLDNIEDKCGVECRIESGEWTQWFDRDDPSGTGDWETLNALRDENPGEICDNPTQIECQTLDGIDYTETGQVVTCNTEIGFKCINGENSGLLCEDYKVRVYCESTLICEEEVPQCFEVDPKNLFQGACTDLSAIDELNIPQCCTDTAPRGIDCGVYQEWVVGIAIFPVCYISNS